MHSLRCELDTKPRFVRLHVTDATLSEDAGSRSLVASYSLGVTSYIFGK